MDKPKKLQFKKIYIKKIKNRYFIRINYELLMIFVILKISATPEE